MLKINFLGFREKTSFKTADQRCNIPSTVKHDYSLKTNSRLQQSQLNFHYSFNLIMIHILLMVKENYAYNKTK